MITIIQKFVHRLLYDELAVRRWARSFTIGVATAGVGFADQLANLLESPDSARKIKIAGVVCAMLGGAITAGEKNPPKEQRT